MASRRTLAGWITLAVALCVVRGSPAQALGADDAAPVQAATRAAGVRTAAELLPSTTLFYVEMNRPDEVLRLVLDHPLRRRLEQSPEYQKAFDTPQFKEFLSLVQLSVVTTSWMRRPNLIQ